MPRQQVLKEVGRFDPHPPKTGQPVSPGFTVHFADAPEQALDADEAPFGVLDRVLDQEGAVAAAQFHLQRLGGWEQGGTVKQAAAINQKFVSAYTLL